MSWQPPSPPHAQPLPQPTQHPAGPPQQYWAPAPVAPAKTANVVGIIAAVAAGVLALGSFLPWVTVQAGIFGSISVNGMDGDGTITVQPGIGLFVCVAGGIAALVLGIIATTQTR